MKSTWERFINRIWNATSKNSGFSMVELIIVIAIVGLMSGSAFSIFNHLRYADLQKAVKTIEDNINKLQVSSMSQKDKPVLYIYCVDNNTYLKVQKASESLTRDKNGILLGNSNITVKGVDSSGVEFGLKGSESTNSIKVIYQRSGVYDYGTGKTNVKDIKVSGKKAEYTLSLMKNTGKVKLN